MLSDIKAEEPGIRLVQPAVPAPIAAAALPLLPKPMLWRRVGAGLLLSVGTALEERRILVLVPFAVICGIAAAVLWMPVLAPPALGVCGLLGLAVWLYRSSLTALRLVSLGSGFLAGMVLVHAYGQLLGTQMLARPAYGSYRAQVDEVLSEIGDEKRLIVSAIVALENSRDMGIRRARIFVRASPSVGPGDEISGRFRFYPVPAPVLPGGYDSQFHSYFDGVGAYGTVIGPLQVAKAEGKAGLQRRIAQVRSAIAERIDANLSQPSSGIARAIINGDQSAVAETARDVMAMAGLAHVLSISGLHLTLVAGGVFTLLRWLLSLSLGFSRYFSIKQIAAAGGIVAAVCYFAISGGNVAALRSTIMIILVFAAVIFGRRALTMRNVAIAALVVLASDPVSIFRPSFQLSFAAVVALVGTYELALSRRPSRDRGALRQLGGYFGGLATTSLVAGAATLLFSAYHFQQTSPLGVLGNLASLPLVSFLLMPAALIAVLMMPFGLEWAPLQLVGWTIERMLDVGAVVAGLSAGIDASPLLSPAALVIGLGGLAIFGFLKDYWRLLGPALAIPLVILSAVDAPPDMLVADATQAMALRNADGLHLVRGKQGSFAAEVWSETFGFAPPGAAPPLKCDSVSCVGSSPAGFNMALVENAAGFAEDCSRVDLVVTRLTAPSYCRDLATVIDAEDLARSGTAWVRWRDGRFEIRHAVPDLNRPWRVLQP